MKPPEKLYEFHVANLQSVDSSLTHVLAAARLAIGRGETPALPTYTRMYAVLLGAWAECRLLKLLYEPMAFDPTEREAILRKNALDRWLAVLEIAFRRHYNIPRAPLTPPALPATAADRLARLKAILNDDLGPVITLRNKLAHGQWAFPLNDDLDDVAQAQADQLRRENLLSLKFKWHMIESFCSCVHDLVVSKPTFDRDFDRHLRQIEQRRTDLRTRSFASWQATVSRRYEHGQDEYRRRIRVGP